MRVLRRYQSLGVLRGIRHVFDTVSKFGGGTRFWGTSGGYDMEATQYESPEEVPESGGQQGVSSRRWYNMRVLRRYQSLGVLSGVRQGGAHSMRVLRGTSGGFVKEMTLYESSEGGYQSLRVLRGIRHGGGTV